MNRFFTALAAFFLITLVTGCGQSGKLYIPGDPSELKTMPSARQGGGQDTETTTEDDEKENAKEQPAQ